MANTIESTTDEALLRSIIDGSITEFEDDTITGKLPQYKFYSCDELKTVNLPNATSIGQYCFYDDDSLTSVSIPSATALGNYCFANCTNLKSIDVSGVTNLSDGQGSIVDGNQCYYLFSGCSSLKALKFDNLTTTTAGNRPFGNETSGIEAIVLPSLTRFANSHIKNMALKKLDVGTSVTLFTDYNYTFNATNFEALVIRATSIPTLDHANLLGSSVLATDSTKGQSGKNSTYKIYVPQSLVSSYKTATNWSNYSTFFTAIEGSRYEHYWADGTPVGMEKTSGMVAYYDVGNADDWDGTTKFLISHVDCDFKAYRCNSRYSDINTNNPPDIPTTFYDEYANCGLGIYFGDTISNITDVLTLEFLFAANNNAFNFNTESALDGYAGNQVTGYVSSSPSLKAFRHIVLEIKEGEGFKVYCDKELKITNTSKTSVLSDVDSFRIIQGNNSYLGHVSVWNRALTQEEIAEHYQYYVDNFHVGETAFDSDGNFIAE